ncbi:hypothetical protein F5Y15DRAFT_412422 [Xylariaceae sp. FL0016]|nr:hypothetical protein F5Y15DRAFT_412422 [Xylariaceae sp. FL0016]
MSFPMLHGALIVRKKYLIDAMPRAGLTYPFRPLITHTNRRDKMIVEALKATGYEEEKSGIRRALVPMFERAIPIMVQGRAASKDLWDMLQELRQQLHWAAKLPGGVFLELFVRLVEARQKWAAAPVPPFFDYSQYDDVVLALVNFRKAVGDCPQNDDEKDESSWILAEAFIYNELAGGLDEDEM